ncbi:hypothetical protein LshimejAT787_0112450 [Lyophyllum shimeji]|uniref:DUF6589 domain-containing protein n=1 Tax=Lyophyllum shimeji TaxID=47721 RepID=A0A9P3UKG6_LYOSH|nr:hypothetical protein LshimejAT787_0112450 [Lyophyllum shimeji]
MYSTRAASGSRPLIPPDSALPPPASVLPPPASVLVPPDSPFLHRRIPDSRLIVAPRAPHITIQFLQGKGSLDLFSLDLPLPASCESASVQGSPLQYCSERKRSRRKRKGEGRPLTATLAKSQAARATVVAQQKKAACDEVLQVMRSKGLRFNDLMEHVFDPSRQQGGVRWHEFFVFHGSATKILDWWTSSKNSKPAREEVKNWAVQFVSKIISSEARTVTHSKELQTMGKTIDESFITAFDFTCILDKLQDMASVSIQMLTSFATSPRSKKHTPQRKARTALPLHASGRSQRQPISVLSTLGLSESYSNIVSRPTGKKKTENETEDSATSKPTPATQSVTTTAPGAASNTPVPIPREEVSAATNAAPKCQRTGTLHQLSGAMRDMARTVAATGLYGLVYDNINIMFRAAEQIVGRHDSQENGTCATIFRLWKAKLADIKIPDFQQAFLTASPLNITDILHNKDEARRFKQCLIFTIMRVAILAGSEGFKKFEKETIEKQPISPFKIDVHQTELHPLPTWNIDESTIVGNAEVDEAIIEELQLRKSNPAFPDTVRFMGGDQLSLARLRALENIRAGHEAGHAGFFWGAWMPGLFHAKIADMHGMLVTHWGKPVERNPASLAFHNTRLDRLPITLTSLPPFRTCRDLVFISLYARILHCLLLVSGCATLEEYTTRTMSWDDFQADALQIYERFASTSVVDELRHQRAQCKSKPVNTGDMVFENAVLFMRDALISREYADAIKAGDSGWVLLVLKIWALSFRGSGRTKYAYEMLHIIHNLTHVWPKPIREIILNNWLLNPTGKPNSFVEMDLVQEHLNFWIKSYYKAYGSNASWEWLELVAPCVTALRHLANGLNDLFGDDQGTRHAPPDLTEDIETLMESLVEYRVYQIIPGRIFDEDDPPANDIITVGLQNMMDNSKSPLTEYVVNFLRLQQRRRKQPIIIPSPSTDPTTTTTSTLNTNPEPEPVLAPPTITPVTRRHTEGTLVQRPQTSVPVASHTTQTSGVDDVNIFDSDGEDDGQDTSEIDAILDELQSGEHEPTLTREGAEDVALDMDKVYDVEVDDIGVLSGSEDGEDTGDDGDSAFVF